MANESVNMEAVKSVANEVYAVIEAASRFANKEEMRALAINVDEVCRNVFGQDVWREATYEGM